MATSCGYEFQLKHFRFVGSCPNNFYEMQWTRNRKIFLFCRTFLFFYQWAWMIPSWIFASDMNYYTLSNWSFFFTGVYFLSAFATALYGVVSNDDSNSEGGLRWFHQLTWFWQVIALSHALFVSILFWGIIVHDVPPESLRDPLGQHKHSVQTFLVLVDLFLVAFPVRLLHFIYVFLLSSLYSIFTIIIHFSGVNSRIYSIVDYVNNPGLSVGFLLGVVSVGSFVLQTIAFALYHLRAFIYRKTVGRKVSAEGGERDSGHTNVVFTPDTV